MPQAGDNSDKLLKSYTDRIVGLLGQIAEIKSEVKEELTAAKGAGLDIKALLKVSKELMMEEGQREKQLSFEWEVDAYRRVVGLPTGAPNAQPQPVPALRVV